MLSLILISPIKKVGLTLFFLILFCAIVLGLSIRGNYGSADENQLKSAEWKEKGPFELSPERGRFALIYSIVENHSFRFSPNLARFAAPDVAVTKDGEFVSLFAPTVSFIAIPGYLIGKQFGISQVGTYAVIAIFALLNVFLIRAIAQKIKVGSQAATIGAIVFLFATPAFAYAVSLYQHHISAFLILLSIYLLISFRSFWSQAGIFFLYSLAVTVDYPNLFMMLPIALASVGKMFYVENLKEKVKIVIKFPITVAVFAAVLPLLFFLWFNQASYNNPIQLSGTLKTIRDFKQYSDFLSGNIQGLQPSLEQEEVSAGKKTAVGFFNTRNLANGLYLHLLSQDRGILYFTPVMFFSLIGIVLSYRKKVTGSAILVAVLGINILLYSMWSDPWGGWAFGSRYLIPAYAVLVILLSLVIDYFKKSLIFGSIFLIVFIYSVAVNTLGVLTTSANPPKIEALPLEKLSGIEQKYTYERNIDFLKTNGSKSFFYGYYTKNFLKAWQYYFLVLGIILVPSILIIAHHFFIKGRRNK